MKKPLVVILFLLMLMGIALHAQALITIGYDTTANTTTGNPSPYGTFYKNFRQQYLYTAAEIETAGGGAGPLLLWHLMWKIRIPVHLCPALRFA